MDHYGSILVAGNSYLEPESEEFAVGRFLADGRFDRSFGRLGYSRVPSWPARRVAIDSQGRIVVASSSGVSRFLSAAGPEVVRLRNGYDRTAPRIRLRQRCRGGRRLALVRVRDLSQLERLTVRSGGRARSSRRKRVAFAIPRRARRITAIAVDLAGNEALQRAPTRSCR